VAFIDVADEASRALVEQIAAQDLPRPWFERCDVTDIAALQSAVARAAAALEGDFQVLVNNVARDDRHALADVTEAFWDRNMAVNQRPAFFAIQAVTPGMQRCGGGSIVNLGSTGWQLNTAGYPCYAIAKSSVNGLTHGLARSLGAHRIRINTVSPGWVMTERQVTRNLDAHAEARLREDQCLPDLLQGEDIARMVLFLASDDGAMCTAQEFKVDAGWL
jgi:NAD(P)-dependent dehydrogenase (short-subunit alcohol dehydrogenase family)